MRTFKNKELYKDTLQHLINIYRFDIEWRYIYNDVVNNNMNLDKSIRSVFLTTRCLENQVDWAYSEFSKSYHKIITNYNLKKKFRRKTYRI